VCVLSYDITISRQQNNICERNHIFSFNVKGITSYKYMCIYLPVIVAVIF
jgi:hypothetical protein